MKKSESENKNKVSENSKSNDAVSVSVSGGKKKKIRKKRITAGRIVLIIILLIIAAIAAIIFVPPLRSAVFGALIKNQISSASAGYRYYTVERHDITTTLTGTGTLQPYDSYTVTTTVTGDILSADFEEMDKVQKDDVLYVIDSSDIEDDIEEKRKDVADALEDYNDALADYEDLNIISDYSGTVRDVYVDEGDSVANGAQIAYIVDSDTMLLDIPFFAANTDNIRTGATAIVTFASTGEVLNGYVSEISNLTSTNANNSTVRNITISVKNPGGITFGMSAYASVIGTDGSTYDCAGSGTFKYNEEETITASASGKIETLNIKEGDKVSKGFLAAVLESETLDSQAEQLKKTYDNQVKALEDLMEQLEDYTVKAPISGTIVQKNYKELDTIGSSSMSSTTSLAIIYDMSKLTFDLNIDELDLSLIEVGQNVKITSDSIENEEFSGIVTKKSIVGSSSGGTTVYPVTVEIEGNDKLLPGMNINAEIVISNTENVIAVPVSAVSRGNTVEIIKSGFTSEDKEGVLTEKPETETVKVELGANDEDYIEIKSGLSEGDIVIYEMVNVSQNMFSSMFGMGATVVPVDGASVPMRGSGGEMPSGGGQREFSGGGGMPSGGSR